MLSVYVIFSKGVVILPGKNKIVLYTQRVEIVESYQERRDCADQNIPRFLEYCGYLPVPMPNVLQDLEGFVSALQPTGIVLTGGNSLVCYGGEAPERDRTEEALLSIALEKEIPVYGFCRGMQSVLHYFGCKLEEVDGHVAVRHTVDGIWGRMEVNSYHNQACREVKSPLEEAQRTEDGVIEAAVCPEKRLVVTMWHPEREKPFAVSDVRRVQELFG